ncbi:MAG TPA: transcription antitermination factor NusB [Thiotrichaceae bacterium]|jgi:N utilization substance protein B|nr:transcription antitermination factor NusB [Thiotrichaceae bacterium]HIM08234.1 transcription antitermination factor NusB [Gammaproteobacteria bacterium]
MSTAPVKINKRARIKARRSTVQALYQYFLTGKDVADVIAEFESDKHTLAKTDVDYFKHLLRGTIKSNDELDAQISKLLDRPVDELDAIERAILHIGCYELQHHIEIPWRVVVNESIELAKLFGAEESHKYINGILDKVARELRSTEINGNR